MNPQELRRLNLLQDGTGKTIHVRAIHELYILASYTKDSYTSSHDVEDIHPIPLSHELLIRAGFEAIDLNHFRFTNNYTIYEVYFIPETSGSVLNITKGNKRPPRIQIGIHTEEGEIPAPIEDNLGRMMHQGEETQYFVWDIEFVHQLQNIFFTLTGKELEFAD